jgi:hypothetical protein
MTDRFTAIKLIEFWGNGSQLKCSRPRNMLAGMKEPCSMKNDLFTARQEAADAYAGAVAELARKISVASRREYELLNQVAEMTRKRSQQAHADLETHVASHCCDGG